MVNSLVWTAEEAKYLKAVLRWHDSTSDEKRARRAEEEASRRRRRQQEQEKPAGEFRVLVIGARGTGKTAILTRVRIFPLLDPHHHHRKLTSASSAKAPSTAKGHPTTPIIPAAVGTPSPSPPLPLPQPLPPTTSLNPNRKHKPT
jgi:hypothetical protein